jgi:hypothetical protein
VNPTEPPYAYYIERPKGDVTHDHSHNAGRTEFLSEGEIEWREAGTVYGYTVLQDAKF